MIFEKLENGNVILRNHRGNPIRNFLPTNVLVQGEGIRITRNNRDNYDIDPKTIKLLVTPEGKSKFNGNVTNAQYALAEILMRDFFFLDSIFGDYRQFFENTDDFSTNIDTFQTAAAFTTQKNPAGTYYIHLKFSWSADTTNRSSTFGLFVDGVQVGEINRKEVKDISDQETIDYFAMATFASAGIRNIELRALSEQNTHTLTVHSTCVVFYRFL